MHSNEHLSAEIERRHNLGQLHIFKQGDTWRVFGSRRNPKGFQVSVEEGRGSDISTALTNLDMRLASPPTAKTPFAE